ncbi:DUF4147 domain-containing protein [Paracoccus sp. Z118]|nr:DUF4147 domain-containing protein [Paracoccus sp. Z118]
MLLALISGGSALMARPVPPLTALDKSTVNKLLNSGLLISTRN